MLYSAVKLLCAFNVLPKSSDADVLLLAVVLHDSLKYGVTGDRQHTSKDHDKLAGDLVNSNRETFSKILSESQVNILEESVRYHSGRWSTDVIDRNNFDFSDRSPVAMFVHILDMMSSNNLLKVK